MKPVKEMGTEHGAIRKMLRVMEKMASLLEAKETVPAEEMKHIVEFIRVFADQCHHGKEEALYFPAMLKVAEKEEIAVINELLDEHTVGRGYIATLEEMIGKYEMGDDSAGEKIASDIRSYISLLDQHINKENHVLFPTTDKYLSPEVQQALETGFKQIENEVIGRGKHAELQAILDGLSAKYLS